MKYECSHKLGQKKCHKKAVYIATYPNGRMKQVCENHMELYKELGCKIGNLSGKE